MPRRRKLSRGRTSAGPWTWSPLPELRTTLPCLTMLHEHTRECLAIYVPGAILLSCPGSGRRPLASAHPPRWMGKAPMSCLRSHCYRHDEVDAPGSGAGGPIGRGLLLCPR